MISEIWLLNKREFYRKTRQIEANRVLLERNDIKQRVLALKAEGYSTSAIADRLGIGRRTIQRYITGK